MSQDQKKNRIIDAALKRFSHFGVGKTTMNEIADDLSISKASLYYYFPDKLNLYAAVLQKIIEEEVVKNTPVKQEADPLQALFTYLDRRTEFIIQHYNILEFIKTLGNSVPEELAPVFSAARNRELSAISSIFSKGAEAALLKMENPEQIAELLLDCLDGLRHSLLVRQNNFFPDKAHFHKLAVREKEVATIFINGLSC